MKSPGLDPWLQSIKYQLFKTDKSLFPYKRGGFSLQTLTESNPTISSNSKTQTKRKSLNSFHPYFSFQKSRKILVRFSLITPFVFLRIRTRSPSRFLFHKLSKSQFSSFDMKPPFHPFSSVHEARQVLRGPLDKQTSNFTLAFHHISSTPEPSCIKNQERKKCKKPEVRFPKTVLSI